MLRDILETEHDDGEAFLVSGRNAALPDSVVSLETFDECSRSRRRVGCMPLKVCEAVLLVGAEIPARVCVLLFLAFLAEPLFPCMQSQLETIRASAFARYSTTMTS